MNEQTTETGKKTWKNYYWYYYKWHIFIALALVVTIVICTAQCMAKVDPDCYVLFYADKYYADEILTEVTDEIAKYATDVNGDGKISIMPVNCTFAERNTERRNLARQQAILQMTTDNTSFWVLDASGVSLYYENEGIDIFAVDDSFNCYDNHAVRAKNLEGFKKIESYEGREFYVFARKGKDKTSPNKIATDILEKIEQAK